MWYFFVTFFQTYPLFRSSFIYVLPPHKIPVGHIR